MHPDLDPRGALARLLRALPEEAESPYDFREFQRRATERMAAAHGTGTRRLFAAAAASAVMALALLWRLSAPSAPQIASGGVSAPGAVPAVLSARPELMEHWLASFPQDPALVRVGTRAAVTSLEDRIAQLDDLLSVARMERAHPAHLDALQQERTRLVGALVQVRYAETLADATQ
jgi:hypothetical protein